MERFWCYGIGFCIAILLVMVFTIVKSEVEERKEKSERRLKARMQSVFWESLEKVRPYQIRGLDKYIDHKLVEKEGRR
jgi:uncharacterized membrane protein YgaE (UPF0421/DUF939 family)